MRKYAHVGAHVCDSVWKGNDGETQTTCFNPTAIYFFPKERGPEVGSVGLV